MKKKRNQLAIESGKERLKFLRKQQRELRKEIDAIREAIRQAGGDPDAPEVNLIPRNKEIYKAWKDGRQPKELASEFRLTPERIRSICARIDKILEHKRFHFNEYKDLLPYFVG